MGFKKGALVIYNAQNWVINDIQQTTTPGGVFVLLTIKNIITNEVKQVDSNDVKEFVVTNRTNKVPTEDTKFINDLFNHGISAKDTVDDSTDYDLFKLNTDEHGIDIDDVELERFDNFKEPQKQAKPSVEQPIKTTQPIVEPVKSTVEVTKPIVEPIKQTFEPTKPMVEATSSVLNQPTQPLFRPTREANQPTQPVFKPKKDPQATFFERNLKEDFKAIPVVDETISNMSPIGELNTYEFIPTRLRNAMPNQGNNLNLNSKMPDNPQLDKEITREMNFNENQSRLQPTQPRVEPERSKTFDSPVTKPGINYINDNIYESGRVSKSNTKKVSDTNSNSSTQTEKMLLGGITSNFGEKTTSKTKTFGPLNTKKLLEEYENQQDQIVKKAVVNPAEDELTGLVYKTTDDIKKEVLKNSKLYNSFKKLSIGLITLFVLVLLVPLLGIFAKLAVYWLTTGAFNLSILSQIFLTAEVAGTSIIYLVADVFLLIITPLLVLTFAIYLIYYLVTINNKQFQRFAIFNQSVKAKDQIIDGIQEYNSQTSRYFVKIHNDMKTIKKEVEELKKVVTTPNSANEDQPRNIAH